jgi:hypothetical protein
VIGRNERYARTPRCAERTPGRCTAACVQQIDIVLADQSLQPAHVGKHAQRVLGGRGKRNDLGAGRLNPARETPTLRGNECACARPCQRLGDFHRRQFRTARIELRNDLQYGRRLVRQGNASPACDGT